VAAVYRPWVSPYDDDDFEWNRKKSYDTFADRDFVFEGSHRIPRAPYPPARHEAAAFQRAALYGARRVVRASDGDYLHAAQSEVPDHFDASGQYSGAEEL
jgi:hypothetical protein